MVKTAFYTSLSDFAFLPSMRSDVNSHLFFDIDKAEVWPNSTIELSEVLTPIKSEKIEKGDLENDEILIDMANIERRYNELVNLKEVSSIGSDKNIISRGDIVIPKIQPRMGNIFLNSDKKRYICSSELIEYRCNKGMYIPKFLFYLITHPQFAHSLYYLESGKTHRRVNPVELLKYKIPAINLQKQHSIILRIESIEKKIHRLKAAIKDDRDIINNVIENFFDIDIEELHRLDGLKDISIEFMSLSGAGMELRNSVRFTKMRLIQQEMIRHFDDYAPLDEFLILPKTKNGWSPENNELEGDTKLLGIDSLHFNGVLTADNPKFTNETRDDIDNFYVNNGDFFVSRGNTVDLVALASIAENIEEEFLYPDIMIKLFVDGTKIDKHFLVYMFNSIIGRLYFKYASKGKQQTMVKVSSDTIRNFIIPKISLEKQKEIVKEIRKKSNAQNKIRNQIKDLRDEIDLIIEKAIIHDTIKNEIKVTGL